ncbi:MAG: HAD-IA family hydrolase [Pseudomonadota bacterium]
MTKLAIFDCDGTLVDSGGTIHRALRSTFDSHGLDCPPRGVTKKVIGLSLDEAFATLVPDGDHPALSRTYKDAFFAMRSQGVVEEPLFDGIVAALEAFRAAGWSLGVATGKSRRGLDHCLAAHGIADLFVTLQTADNHPSKPHPSMVFAAMEEASSAPDRTVFIGDTAWDMGSARSAACGAIGAGWGYHDESELRDAGAHDVAQDPAELVAMSERWIGEQQ